MLVLFIAERFFLTIFLSKSKHYRYFISWYSLFHNSQQENCNGKRTLSATIFQLFRMFWHQVVTDQLYLHLPGGDCGTAPELLLGGGGTGGAGRAGARPPWPLRSRLLPLELEELPPTWPVITAGNFWEIQPATTLAFSSFLLFRVKNMKLNIQLCNNVQFFKCQHSDSLNAFLVNQKLFLHTIWTRGWCAWLLWKFRHLNSDAI